MEKIEWLVEGMTCSNCALSIRNLLEKEGMQAVSVNPISGKVQFDQHTDVPLEKLKKEIESLGYQVNEHFNRINTTKSARWNRETILFLITLPFTFLLLLHMVHHWLPIHWIMQPGVQFFLCLPVFLIGWYAFGKSAWHSIRSGISNMNVLVLLGASAAFIYSLVGWLYYGSMHFVYFETTASIISLVFFGNYLEAVTIRATGKALKKLTQTQQIHATMIAFNEAHEEQLFTVDAAVLKTGDLILIKTGEQVPADCKILWGEAEIDESLLTGESLPINKTKKDSLIGGSMILAGLVKAQVTATGKEAVLSGIVKLVEQAQLHKPPIQQLADKISAVFVPVVIGISLCTFLLNYFIFSMALDASIMRAIAVLVISCPCAMGLATPAAISVGLGRAARLGIIYRNAQVLESFRHIKQVVFDKTGTLTTGNFQISSYETSLPESHFKSIVYSLEIYTTHPIAVSLCKQWKTDEKMVWKHIQEIKGVGMVATDSEGHTYKLGSIANGTVPVHQQNHDLYVFIDDKLVGWIDIMDEIRPEVPAIIQWLKKSHIEPIMLTGDTARKANAVAASLGIEKIYAQHTPAQKLERVEWLCQTHPTAMVGDGINDAPALAKASIGISMAEATQLAMQSADVVLLHGQLKKLPMAIGLGKHTYKTVIQNLTWAFAYNIIAIPIAAIGLLSPTFSALSMGLSDVMLACISLFLFVKKVDS